MQWSAVGRSCWAVATVLVMMVVEEALSASKPLIKRHHIDMLFSNATRILERKVMCENIAPDGGTYPTDTWSCYNLKVDGQRLSYGGDNTCSDGGGGKDYDHKNALGPLCVELMRANGISKGLWAAFVDEASCRSTTDPRVIFVQNKTILTWEENPAGRGYVKTLRCMTVAD